MTGLELVTGGARSGKSTFAERRAAELAAVPQGRPVAYVATAVITDAEMAERIEHHRARRPAGWQTVEAPEDLAAALETAARSGGVVLVDCLAVWAANRLLALGDPKDDAGGAAGTRSAWRDRVAGLESDMARELDAGIDACSASGADIVLVTNEVGLGIVPATPLGRAYRDLLGRLNQHVAGRARAVHLVIAGIAVNLIQFPHSSTRRP